MATGSPSPPRKSRMAQVQAQLDALDALYKSTGKLLHDSQKDRLSIERQVVWKHGQPRIHPALLNGPDDNGSGKKSLAGSLAAASRASRRRRTRDLIAENVLSQGRPRGQLLRVIRQIEGQIDAPLKRRLRDGSIRLLRCAWLMDENNLRDFLQAEEGAEIHAADGNITVRMRRMQDPPPVAFFEPEEAAALLARGDRSVLALSYTWLTRSHPDPHGVTLSHLFRFLSEHADSYRECALFWDFASLPQPDETGYLDKDSQATFAKALEVMYSPYASVKGTTVLQIKDAHENLPPAARASASSYNLVPYESRGWCILEQSAGVAIEAHIDGARRERRLPADLIRAAKTRPKVMDISIRSRPSAVRAEGLQPQQVLQQAVRALSEGASFTGEADGALVSELLERYSSTVQRAVEEPPSSAREFLSGPIDLNLGSRDAQRPVFHPAGATGGIYARPLKAGGEIFSRPSSASASRRAAGHGAAGARPQSAGPLGSRAPLQ